MNALIKAALVAAVITSVSGCTGSVYNKQKNCNYDYLFHPAISLSKMIGGCGPVDKS
ncbi:YhfL family protein [Pantoea sp. 1.19]|uniref:YhfL family protein n=1 Tax=Pantoea sp. 1.19 TaxID=1925589 RepID=UPI000948DCC0|nr:YhfL family protein [Pantoea sp. 1.19]